VKIVRMLLTAVTDDVTSEEEKPENRLALSDPEDSENLPVFLWRPGQTTDALGSWERHTRVLILL
jgi:hypothetical protein